jgi:hypothetical protein
MTTPITPIAPNSSAPDVSAEKMRQDFYNVWIRNLTIVIQQRMKDTEAGNYGSDNESEEFEVDKEIYLNIQGSSSNAYKLAQYGLDTTQRIYKCYALHTEDFVPRDRIIWGGRKFRIVNLNQGLKNGTTGPRIFWELEIVSVDKE